MSKLWLIAQYEYERRVTRRTFLLGTLSVPLAVGIAVGASLLLRSLNGTSAAPGPDATIRGGALLGGGQLLPALSGVLFVLLVALGAGPLLGAVADEKTNRTIEILVTSISPRLLMRAKLLAVLALILTQLVTWIACAALLGLLGRRLGLAWLQGLRVDSSTAWTIGAVLVPSYVGVAALLVALGAILRGGQPPQQATTLLVTLYLAPGMFALSMLHTPNHPLMVALSLLPFTAPVVLPLRAAFSALPAWQVGAGAAIQALCALGAVWLASRALRLGLLRYGRRLRWREIVGRPAPARPSSPERGARHRQDGPAAAPEPAARGRSKTWLILRHEFTTTVTRPLYVGVCLGLPLLVLAQLGTMVYSSWSRASSPGSGVPPPDAADLARLVSLLVMLLLYGMILMASGLMLRSVSEEKKNRVMELLLLSVHPRQMLAGKTIAHGLAGMIQAAIWAAMGGTFVFLGGSTFHGPTSAWAGITLSPAVLAWWLVFALLGYALYACLYAGAGALLPDWRASRQATLLIALPALIGFQIGLFTTDNPHGPLAVVASLFPLTAPFVMVKRLVVPGLLGWQPPVAAGLLALSIPLVMRAVARMFHAQNLLSGQPFSVRRYLRALSGRE